MEVGFKAGRSLILLAVALLLVTGMSACASSRTSSRRSPTPAASVTALPGLSQSERKQDPAAYAAAQDRAINVFLKDDATTGQRRAMAARIAAMPEVVAYHYVDKREALVRATRMFEAAGRSAPTMSGNPLPASFDILLRSVADVSVVAARFYDDPLVDNDPGTHNGVMARGGSTLLTPSPAAP